MRDASRALLRQIARKIDADAEHVFAADQVRMRATQALGIHAAQADVAAHVVARVVRRMQVIEVDILLSQCQRKTGVRSHHV